MLCVKELIKMARLHSCIRASISTLPGFLGTNANWILTELFHPSKLSNSGPSRLKRSHHGQFSLVPQSSRRRERKPNVWRIISRKWYTFGTREFLIKIMKTTAVKAVGNVTVQKKENATK